MHDLSDYQRKVLLKNPNIDKITDKHVVYTSEFKILAVKKYLSGFSPIEIFEDAKIDSKYFIKKYCQSCLKRWKKKFLEDGERSLKSSQTGKKATGRPRLVNSDEMTIDEMKAMIEIQQEVIKMLKKNRALTKKKKVI